MAHAEITERQEVTTKLPIGSSFLPFGTIIGISIGVAMALVIGGVAIAIYNIRKTRKREATRAKGKDAEVGQDVAMMVRANPSPLLYPTFGTPYDSLPIQQVSTPSGFVTSEDEDDNIIRPNTKRFSGQKNIFRKSGIRDSWPLASFTQTSTRQLPLQVTSSQRSLRKPPERNIRLNCVAPPGYVLPDEPQKPARAFSRRAHAKNSDSLEDITVVDGEPTISRGRTRQRSSSENQLSVILKSTSQRLRDTHRRSLGRFPGSPPKSRLPSPPANKATESRELLIRPNTASSDHGSQYDRELFRTPSPGKKVPRIAGRAFQKRGRSPTPSGHSDDDSLCSIDTPDLVIPAQLTSPSKSGRKFEQRHRMNLSTSNIPAPKIHHAKKPSVGTIDKTDFGISSPILGNDPFLSIESTKVIPGPQIFRPQPLHIRKATFGQHETEEKSLGYIDSPLNDISGNQAGPLVKEPKSPSPSEDPNPFQWSPQEAMQVRKSSSSKASPKRKGHKRSKIVRISGLPRPSSVSVVHEESEDDSSPHALRRIISRPTLRVVEKSPSCTSLSLASRRSSAVRPPSSLTFNPILSIPTLIKPISSSPDHDLEDYSPTLSVYNYYAENTNSEVEFFKHARSSLALKSQVKRYCKDIEEEDPDTPSDILVSFPPLPLKSDDDKVLDIPADIDESPPQMPSSPPPIRPLALLRTTQTNLAKPIHLPPPKTSSIQVPRISAANIFGPRPLSIISPNPGSNKNSILSLPIKPLPLSLPAPPLLTIPTPVHLTGPRPEPRKISSFTTTSSSTHDSIATSIGLLRRMNSELSIYSPSPMDSPPTDGTGSGSAGSARGSKYYLSLGGLGTLGRTSGNVTPTPTPTANQNANSNRDSPSGSPSPITKRASEIFERWRRNGGADDTSHRREGSKSRVDNLRDSMGGSVGKDSRGSSPLAMGKHGLDVEKKRWSMTLLPDGGVDMVEDEGDGLWGGVLGQGLGMVLGREKEVGGEKEGMKIREGWGERWGAGGGREEVEDRRLDRDGWLAETDKENVNLNGRRGEGIPDRPESLGLYDEYGFLKSSPTRGTGGDEFGVIGDGRGRMSEVRV